MSTPTIQNAYVAVDNTLRVLFSEPMELGGAQILANYSILSTEGVYSSTPTNLVVIQTSGGGVLEVALVGTFGTKGALYSVTASGFNSVAAVPINSTVPFFGMVSDSYLTLTVTQQTVSEGLLRAKYLPVLTFNRPVTGVTTDTVFARTEQYPVTPYCETLTAVTSTEYVAEFRGLTNVPYTFSAGAVLSIDEDGSSVPSFSYGDGTTTVPIGQTYCQSSKPDSDPYGFLRTIGAFGDFSAYLEIGLDLQDTVLSGSGSGSAIELTVRGDDASLTLSLGRWSGVHRVRILTENTLLVDEAFDWRLSNQRVRIYISDNVNVAHASFGSQTTGSFVWWSGTKSSLDPSGISYSSLDLVWGSTISDVRWYDWKVGVSNTLLDPMLNPVWIQDYPFLLDTWTTAESSIARSTITTQYGPLVSTVDPSRLADQRDVVVTVEGEEVEVSSVDPAQGLIHTTLPIPVMEGIDVEVRYHYSDCGNFVMRIGQLGQTIGSTPTSLLSSRFRQGFVIGSRPTTEPLTTQYRWWGFLRSSSALIGDPTLLLGVLPKRASTLPPALTIPAQIQSYRGSVLPSYPIIGTPVLQIQTDGSLRIQQTGYYQAPLNLSPQHTFSLAARLKAQATSSLYGGVGFGLLCAQTGYRVGLLSYQGVRFVGALRPTSQDASQPLTQSLDCWAVPGDQKITVLSSRTIRLSEPVGFLSEGDRILLLDSGQQGVYQISRVDGLDLTLRTSLPADPNTFGNRVVRMIPEVDWVTEYQSIRLSGNPDLATLEVQGCGVTVEGVGGTWLRDEPCAWWGNEEAGESDWAFWSVSVQPISKVLAANDTYRDLNVDNPFGSDWYLSGKSRRATQGGFTALSSFGAEAKSAQYWVERWGTDQYQELRGVLGTRYRTSGWTALAVMRTEHRDVLLGSLLISSFPSAAIPSQSDFYLTSSDGGLLPDWLVGNDPDGVVDNGSTVWSTGSLYSERVNWSHVETTWTILQPDASGTGPALQADLRYFLGTDTRKCLRVVPVLRQGAPFLEVWDVVRLEDLDPGYVLYSVPFAWTDRNPHTVRIVARHGATNSTTTIEIEVDDAPFWVVARSSLNTSIPADISYREVRILNSGFSAIHHGTKAWNQSFYTNDPSAYRPTLGILRDPTDPDNLDSWIIPRTDFGLAGNISFINQFGVGEVAELDTDMDMGPGLDVRLIYSPDYVYLTCPSQQASNPDWFPPNPEEIDGVLGPSRGFLLFGHHHLPTHISEVPTVSPNNVVAVGSLWSGRTSDVVVGDLTTRSYWRSNRTMGAPSMVLGAFGVATSSELLLGSSTRTSTVTSVNGVVDLWVQINQNVWDVWSVSGGGIYRFDRTTQQILGLADGTYQITYSLDDRPTQEGLRTSPRGGSVDTLANPTPPFINSQQDGFVWEIEQGEGIGSDRWMVSQEGFENSDPFQVFAPHDKGSNLYAGGEVLSESWGEENLLSTPCDCGGESLGIGLSGYLDQYVFWEQPLEEYETLVASGGLFEGGTIAPSSSVVPPRWDLGIVWELFPLWEDGPLNIVDDLILFDLVLPDEGYGLTEYGYDTYGGF